MLKNQSILVTGGTGSFGHKFVPMTLAKYDPKRLVTDGIRQSYQAFLATAGQTQ